MDDASIFEKYKLNGFPRLKYRNQKSMAIQDKVQESDKEYANNTLKRVIKVARFEENWSLLDELEVFKAITFSKYEDKLISEKIQKWIDSKRNKV